MEKHQVVEDLCPSLAYKLLVVDVGKFWDVNLALQRLRQSRGLKAGVRARH